jgi:hypothetical protein
MRNRDHQYIKGVRLFRVSQAIGAAATLASPIATLHFHAFSRAGGASPGTPCSGGDRSFRLP